MTKADVVANIQFYPTNKGGRATPTPADHLGCIFVFQGENFECRLLLEDVGPIAPGTEARVPIKFLSPVTMRRLVVGSRFQLRESRVIAEGVIEAIADTERPTA